MAMKNFTRAWFALAAVGMASSLSLAQPGGTDIQIPTIEINGVRYNHVTLRIVQAEVKAVGSSSAKSNLPPTCDPNVNLTTANLNRIAVGMNLDQVNAVIGCQYSPPISHADNYCTTMGVAPSLCTHENYSWGSVPNITVWISRATGTVTHKAGGLLFR